MRITVAARLPLERLEQMAAARDYLVRAYVVQRIAPGRLFRFIRDDDRQVRKLVAKRLPEMILGLMAQDPEPEIRRIVASRLKGEDVIGMYHDPDWTVRLAAVESAPLDALRELDESDPEVLRTIEERLVTKLKSSVVPFQRVMVRWCQSHRPAHLIFSKINLLLLFLPLKIAMPGLE